jgi:hypothetical protein
LTNDDVGSRNWSTGIRLPRPPYFKNFVNSSIGSGTMSVLVFSELISRIV